jgi:hypothetical protein
MSTPTTTTTGWLDEALASLGAVLEARGLRYELVVVGGAGLLLRRITSRPTKDVDVLGTRSSAGEVVALHGLPEPLANAVADVGLTLGLAPDWLNLGPASLLELGLPSGFADRLDPKPYGGLTTWIASPFDLACLKLYAAADAWPTRDRHLADLLALARSTDELRDAAKWARTHDPSPAFAENLAAVLRQMGVEDVDDVGR